MHLIFKNFTNLLICLDWVAHVVAFESKLKIYLNDMIFMSLPISYITDVFI